MKKSLLILSTFFILISCRNNENENLEAEASIIGKWSFQKVDVFKSTTIKRKQLKIVIVTKNQFTNFWKLFINQLFTE